MKLAAVVVLYEPEEIGLEKVISNIKSYSPCCGKLYIVDNSQKTHEEIKNSFPSCAYISNKNAGGIAGAQNKGCLMAMEDGFEWCMTMDQDSIFEEGQIEKIPFACLFLCTKRQLGSFVFSAYHKFQQRIFWTKQIRFKILSPLKKKILGKKYRPRVLPEIEEAVRVIASANIIRLKEWDRAGRFDESLFIDEVDYDLCHRLIRDGKKIIVFNQAHLKQVFGKTQPFTLLIKYAPVYGSTRLYYIFRNAFIERFRFPEYKDDYDRLIKEYYWDNCVNSLSLLKNRKIYKKAYNDALLMTGGVRKYSYIGYNRRETEAAA